MSSTSYSSAIFVDLDSTLCDTSHRGHLVRAARARGEEPDWDAYALLCSDDEPVAGVVELVRAMYAQGAFVAIVSSRSSAGRHETLQWLEKHGVPYHRVVLADTSTKEVHKTSSFKAAKVAGLIHEHGPFRHVLMVDDLPVVEEALREEAGVATLIVNPPYKWHETKVGT